MPNNASARRGKDKKNKDKKKKDDKRTDTPSLPKEDTAGMDSGTFSLSSAGKDKAITKDGSSLSFVGTKGAANIAAPKLSDPALLLEFACSLTDKRKLEHTQ